MRRKRCGEFGQIEIELRRIELDSRQEEIRLFVSVLVGEQDVAVVAKDEVGDSRDHTFAVGTGDEEDGGVMHSRIYLTRLCPLW